MLAVTIPAWAADVRPTEADIAHCALVARAAIESPAYDERAPSSPFPRRISGIGPYTGAITPIEAQRLPGGTPPPDVRSPATTGVFGAGGFSQEAESEPGSIDPRLRETFDACMRATLEGRSAGPATPPTEAPPTP
jgi:hypothetical protein